MKKLLQCNAILYAVMYSISLTHAGFCIHWTLDVYRGPEFTYFFVVLACFVLFLINRHMIKAHWYLTAKSCWVMAIVTPLIIGTFSAFRFLRRGQMLLQWFNVKNNYFWDLVIIPGILLFFSVLISVFYIICAIKARKDNQDYIY